MNFLVDNTNIFIDRVYVHPKCEKSADFLREKFLITEKETKARITRGQDGTMTSATRMAPSRLLVNQHSILISPERSLHRSSNPSVCVTGVMPCYLSRWHTTRHYGGRAPRCT